VTDYYCKVSHTLYPDDVTKISVQVQREPFKRPTDMCMKINTYRSERAAMIALDRSLITTRPKRTVLDPAKPPDSFTKQQVREAVRAIKAL